MEGELHKESIFCDAQLLTTHTLSAKGPTLNCDSSVCFGRASFVDRSKNRRKDNVIMKLFVWLLQRVAEMLRNLVLIVSWRTLHPSWLGVFRMVSVLSYKIFGMVVACIKKQEQRETIVDDQRDMDVGKVANPLVESEYVCGELKTKTPSVSLLNFREIELCPKCKVSEGLCGKARDFKLVYGINGNNYLEGTRCFENDLKSVRSRYCIFECSGGYESVTGRRKFRCREPSRISSRVKTGMQKNRKTRCLFRKKVLGTVPRSSILYKFERSTFVLSISLEYQLKRKKRKKKRHIECSISVGIEWFLKIVVKYLRIKVIKVCTRILNSIMT